MRVGLGMPLALIAATFANGSARLQKQLAEGSVVLGLATRDAEGRTAYIGTVQTKPDAFHQFGRVLPQVAVRVGNARLQAVAERVDCSGEYGGVDVADARVAVQHLASVGHERSSRNACTEANLQRPARRSLPAPPAWPVPGLSGWMELGGTGDFRHNRTDAHLLLLQFRVDRSVAELSHSSLLPVSFGTSGST